MPHVTYRTRYDICQTMSIGLQRLGRKATNSGVLEENEWGGDKRWVEKIRSFLRLLSRVIHFPRNTEGHPEHDGASNKSGGDWSSHRFSKVRSIPGTEWFVGGGPIKNLNNLLPHLQNLFSMWLVKTGLPFTWMHAILLPKLECILTAPQSYRPISLLNVDYKLWTMILTAKLDKFISQYIHPDQAGFIQKLQLRDTIRRLCNIINYKIQGS